MQYHCCGPLRQDWLKQKARVGSYLYDSMADSAVRLPAHQQQADYHHHGDGHSHHQQPHHGAAVKRLQCIRLLWTELCGETLDGVDTLGHNETGHLNLKEFLTSSSLSISGSLLTTCLSSTEVLIYENGRRV